MPFKKKKPKEKVNCERAQPKTISRNWFAGEWVLIFLYGITAPRRSTRDVRTMQEGVRRRRIYFVTRNVFSHLCLSTLRSVNSKPAESCENYTATHMRMYAPRVRSVFFTQVCFSGFLFNFYKAFFIRLFEHVCAYV